MRFFTIRRVLTYPWQFWQIWMIGVGSAWQIYDSTMMAKTGASIANLVGALVALFSMVIRNKDTSRAVERWAYIMLIWSMSTYLNFALKQEGWWGLVNQPNFGVLLSEAVILAALQRTIYTIWCGRLKKRKIKREAEELLRTTEEPA